MKISPSNHRIDIVFNICLLDICRTNQINWNSTFLIFIIRHQCISIFFNRFHVGQNQGEMQFPGICENQKWKKQYLGKNSLSNYCFLFFTIDINLLQFLRNGIFKHCYYQKLHNQHIYQSSVGFAYIYQYINHNS